MSLFKKTPKTRNRSNSGGSEEGLSASMGASSSSSASRMQYQQHTIPRSPRLFGSKTNPEVTKAELAQAQEALYAANREKTRLEVQLEQQEQERKVAEDALKQLEQETNSFFLYAQSLVEDQQSKESLRQRYEEMQDHLFRVSKALASKAQPVEEGGEEEEDEEEDSNSSASASSSLSSSLSQSSSQPLGTAVLTALGQQALKEHLSQDHRKIWRKHAKRDLDMKRHMRLKKEMDAINEEVGENEPSGENLADTFLKEPVPAPDREVPTLTVSTTDLPEVHEDAEESPPPKRRTSTGSVSLDEAVPSEHGRELIMDVFRQTPASSVHTNSPSGGGPQPLARTDRSGSMVGVIQEGYANKLESMMHMLQQKNNVQERMERIIKELVQTERDYVKDLRIIVEVFQRPILDNQVVAPQHLGLVFANVPELLEFHSALLQAIEEESAKPWTDQDWGNVFTHRQQQFRELYDYYTSCQPKSRRRRANLEKKHGPFGAFLQEALANPRCRRLDLKSFLIKPVQRICKYPLLLGEMQKCLRHSKSAFEDVFDRLEHAKRVMTDVLNSTNDQMVIADGHMKLYHLQKEFNLGAPEDAQLNFSAPARQWITDDNLVCVRRRRNDKKSRREKTQKLRFVLCSDVLLVVDHADKQVPVLEAVLPLHVTTVVDVGDGTLPEVYGKHCEHVFEIFRIDDLAHMSFVVYANNDRQKQLWLRALRNGHLYNQQAAPEAAEASAPGPIPIPVPVPVPAVAQVTKSTKPVGAGHKRSGSRFKNFFRRAGGSGTDKINLPHSLSPLHTSVRHGRVEETTQLLEEAPDQINSYNHVGDAPLHIACSSATSLCCIPLLVEAGADLTVENANALNPMQLLLALEVDSEEHKVLWKRCLALLWTSGRTEEHLLHMAARHGTVFAVRHVLSECGYKERVDERNADGLTALDLAFQRADQQVVQVILDAGASGVPPPPSGNRSPRNWSPEERAAWTSTLGGAASSANERAPPSEDPPPPPPEEEQEDESSSGDVGSGPDEDGDSSGEVGPAPDHSETAQEVLETHEFLIESLDSLRESLGDEDLLDVYEMQGGLLREALSIIRTNCGAISEDSSHQSPALSSALEEISQGCGTIANFALKQLSTDIKRLAGAAGDAKRPIQEEILEQIATTEQLLREMPLSVLAGAYE